MVFLFPLETGMELVKSEINVLSEEMLALVKMFA
jgi:hypothetical protein